jgi:hypothetical protein
MRRLVLVLTIAVNAVAAVSTWLLPLEVTGGCVGPRPHLSQSPHLANRTGSHRVVSESSTHTCHLRHTGLENPRPGYAAAPPD